MKLKKKWLPLFILFGLVMGAFAYAASNGNLWESIGIKTGAVLQGGLDTQVVAKVGKEEITAADIEIAKITLSAQGKSITKKAILDNVTSRKILAEEAKRRGLYPSWNEALVYVEEMKRMPETAKEQGVEIDLESTDFISKFFGGLEKSGVSQEQYWRSEAVIKRYQEGMAIAKLRYVLAEEWGMTPDKLSTPKAMYTFEKELEDFVSKQRQKTNVLILKPEIFNNI